MVHALKQSHHLSNQFYVLFYLSGKLWWNVSRYDGYFYMRMDEIYYCCIFRNSFLHQHLLIFFLLGLFPENYFTIAKFPVYYVFVSTLNI